MPKNICILLGAGVTVEQNLPQWSDLVRSLADLYGIDFHIDSKNQIEAVGIMEDTILKGLHERLNEYEEIMEVEKRWARKQIAATVRLCFKRQLKNISINDVEKNMVLMKKLVEGIHERAKAGLLTTIITYNFDDYFEFAYRFLFPKDYENHVKVYYMTDNHLPSGECEYPVSVYHVHGCIPIFDELLGCDIIGETRSNYKELQKQFYDDCLEQGIIFSGNDYEKLMDDKVVGWTNMIQYICYSQLPVSVIGFSMTDANFRLLLRRMKKSENKIDTLTLFFGYTENDDEGEKAAKGEQPIVKFMLKDICNEPEFKFNPFGKKTAKAVEDHLATMLK